MEVGVLGPVAFPKGFYAYCGSAMVGLAARINRHLRRKKKVRWHVDYLLEKGRITKVLSAETNERLECQLAEDLGHAFKITIPDSVPVTVAARAISFFLRSYQH